MRVTRPANLNAARFAVRRFGKNRAAGAVLAAEARDEVLYGAGGEYRDGWDYGFVSCAKAKRDELEWATAIGQAIANGGASSHGSDGIDTKKLLKGVDKSDIKAAGW